MEERVFNTWRDPYNDGWQYCRRKQITIKKGLTVLVGCNGAGKTTMLDNIKYELNKENIPYHLFNNLKDGGSNAIASFVFKGNTELAALNFCSSEGEEITNNIAELAGKIYNFIITGRISSEPDVVDMICGAKTYEHTNERWLLLDAVDSGLSIDNVIELKDLFDLIIEDGEKHGIDVYIVVPANEYELARKASCFDVMNGKYCDFDSYEEFRKFIIHTRKKKENRYKKKDNKNN